MPQILAALERAIEGGLRRPLVYNTSGYERVETLQLLDGVVDIYLPDAKYADDETARRLSGFVRYVGTNRAALREMFRQVRDELVLPEGLAGTREVLRWIAENISLRVHVGLVDQYFPAHKAVGHPVLGRKITAQEYKEVGLANGWMQEHREC